MTGREARAIRGRAGLHMMDQAVLLIAGQGGLVIQALVELLMMGLVGPNMTDQVGRHTAAPVVLLMMARAGRLTADRAALAMPAQAAFAIRGQAEALNAQMFAASTSASR